MQFGVVRVVRPFPIKPAIIGFVTFGHFIEYFAILTHKGYLQVGNLRYAVQVYTYYMAVFKNDCPIKLTLKMTCVILQSLISSISKLFSDHMSLSLFFYQSCKPFFLMRKIIIENGCNL